MTKKEPTITKFIEYLSLYNPKVIEDLRVDEVVIYHKTPIANIDEFRR